MSQQRGGSAVAWIAGLALAVPFAVVPGGVLLLGGQSEQQTSAICSPSGGTQALTVSGTVPTVDGFTTDQLTVAATIMQVAQDNGLGYQAQLVGLITAMQESALGANTQATGDGNDAGIFQQRTLPGWYGTLAQVNDPTYAAEKFYMGHDITHAGPTSAGPPGYHLRGLVDVDGWQQMPPTEAAQTVQGSAFPQAYAQHTDGAKRIMSSLAGVEVTSSGSTAADCGGSRTVASGDVQAVIDRAKSLLGTPYDFGGGNETGPGPHGIDCSAFVAYAWTAAGVHDVLPRVTQQQFDSLAAHPVSEEAIQPGDLIFYAYGRTGAQGSPDGISHVALYIGNGKLIEASNSANEVRIRPAQLSDSPAFVGIRSVPAPDISTDTPAPPAP